MMLNEKQILLHLTAVRHIYYPSTSNGGHTVTQFMPFITHLYKLQQCIKQDMFVKHLCS